MDTTFVTITRPQLNTWEYYNKAHKTFGLLYQVIVSLGSPFRILAFDGPFKGSASDVSIFRGSTLNRLIADERVMCDKGYVSEEKCWTPPIGSMTTLTQEQKLERRKVTRIRQLNERLIGRLVTWGIFKKSISILAFIRNVLMWLRP